MKPKAWAANTSGNISSVDVKRSKNPPAIPNFDRPIYRGIRCGVMCPRVRIIVPPIMETIYKMQKVGFSENLVYKKPLKIIAMI